MSVKRGEIYYIKRSAAYETIGSEEYAGRPAIVVSNEKNNENSTVFEVVYLTTQPKKDLPTHVNIRSAKKDSIALCEQVSSVSSERFGNYIGRCNDVEIQQIDIALAISLGIDTMNGSFIKMPETTKNDDIIRLEAERDVYKKLYEQMLERTVMV